MLIVKNKEYGLKIVNCVINGANVIFCAKFLAASLEELAALWKTTPPSHSTGRKQAAAMPS